MIGLDQFPFNLVERCKTSLCGTIPTSSFIDIDIQTSTGIFAYEYFLQLHTADESKAKTLKMLADNNNGSVTDRVYAKSGQLSTIISAIDSSGMYSLRITNNEVQAVDYCIDRVKI